MLFRSEKDESAVIPGEFYGEYCIIENEEMLFDCLDVIVLKDRRTAHTHALSTLPLPCDDNTTNNSQNQITKEIPFDQIRPKIDLKDLLFTNKAAKVVAIDVLSVLLPIALEGNLKSGPIIGSLLTGQRSSGKTTLCESIEYFVQNNRKIVAYSQILDCRLLKGRPVQAILNELSQLFRTAKLRSPSFICLDDLDAICPALPEGSSGVSATQHRLVSLHLECLLSDLMITADKSHRLLRNMVNRHSRHDRINECSDRNDDVLKNIPRHDRINECSDRNDDVLKNIPQELFPLWTRNIHDIAVGEVLRHSVYVLATGKLKKENSF